MSRCRQQSLSADDDALTLDKCEEIFNTLQEDYYEEFKVNNHYKHTVTTFLATWFTTAPWILGAF